MALEHESDSPLAAEVRKAGSQTAFGKLVGRRQSTIYGWLEQGRVPAEDVGEVAQKLGVDPAYLRPDLATIFQTPRASGQSHASPGATSAAGAPCPAAGDSSNTGIPSGREGNAPAAEISEAAAGVSETGERA